MKPIAMFRELVNSLTKLELAFYTDNYYYEINLCEIFTDKDTKYESKTRYKFHYLDFTEKELLLKNKKHKVIKRLSRENVVWISSIYFADKNVKFRLVDFKYAEFDKECEE